MALFGGQKMAIFWPFFDIFEDPKISSKNDPIFTSKIPPFRGGIAPRNGVLPGGYFPRKVSQGFTQL